MNEEEKELMETVDYVHPGDNVNQSDDEILLIDVIGKGEALEKAEQWVDLVATLDGDLIEIGEEPRIEYVDESVIDGFDYKEETKLVR